MNKINQQNIEDFVNACHKAASYNLQQFSSGNMSCRIENNLALLSASRSWLKDITPAQVAVCEIESGECLNSLTPTVESEFHLGILKNRSDIDVVFHFQSPWATSIACGDCENTDFFVIPEIPYYIGKPAIVDTLVPGSKELAQETIQALRDSNTNLAILKHHGFVTVGKTYDDALQRAGFFELACQVILTNPTVKTIPESILSEMGNYKRSK